MKKRKVNRAAKRRNAVKGARITWCPKCKRKAALSRWPGRTCRYCGHKEHRKWSERKVLLEAWEAGEEIPEEPGEHERLANRMVRLLTWATQNEGQNYRLRKALAAWLLENDDGSRIHELAERFAAENDIDAIVARPVALVDDIYIDWVRPGVAKIVVFRDGVISSEIETENRSVQQRAIRGAHILRDWRNQPIRVQYVDIYDVARVWVDGLRKNQWICETQAEARLLGYIAEKAPDDDIKAALEDGRLPNTFEEFRLEVVDLEEEIDDNGP